MEVREGFMKTRIEKVLSIALALTFLVILATRVVSRRGGPPEKRTAPQAAAFSGNHPQVAQTYGKLPLSFEVNQGQTDAQVKFLSRGRGYALFLTGDEMVLSLPSRQSSVLSRQLSASRSWKLETGNSKLAGGNLPGFGDRSGAPGFGSLLPTSDFLLPVPVTSTPKPQPSPPSVVRLQLVGANTRAKAVGLEELPGKSNYFIGNDPKKWRTNVATYAKVKYQGVYPGVDLVYYGHEGEMEYDFVVAPGADPHAIRLALVGEGSALPRAAGGRPYQIDARGDLVIASDAGEVRFHKPVVYQEDSSAVSGQLSVAETKTPRATDKPRRTTDSANPKSKIQNPKFLHGKYVLLADNRIGFEVSGYDPTRPLVIDPVLVYSTYLGGSSEESGKGIAVDAAGNAYVTGYTRSTNFPTTSGATQSTYAGSYDAFVAKLSADGSSLMYSTYLGGSNQDIAYGIAVDSSGSAYVTGQTYSSNFPTTSGARQTTNAGGYDAFVAKLSADGSSLMYSTYLGGGSTDNSQGIAVDSFGNAYVTGYTVSTNFPTTSGAKQTTFAGSYDAFVAKLSADGSSLMYSTYLGGGSADYGFGIAVDVSGSAYVTGYTQSTNFPTTSGAKQTTNAGNYDAFVAKLSADGSSLMYSTYLGGSNADYGQGIAVDSSGNAYVTGYTQSTNFPTTSGATQTTYAGNYDAFVAKLSADGSSLMYSTYLGGANTDYGQGIAVDSSGNAYVTGETHSTNFPTAFPFQAALAAPRNAFVTKLNAAGTALLHSSYLGGGGADAGYGIAVDSAGNAYVAGQTYSTNFPTVNPLQATNAGGPDAFVTKIAIPPPGPDLAISKTHTGNFTQGQTDATYALRVSSVGTVAISSMVTVVDTLPTSLSATAMDGDGWTCTVDTLTCTRSDTLAPGSSYPAITLTVDVASDAPSSVINTATVSVAGDVYADDNTATDRTTILVPPTADSVTPTPASAANQTFSLSYSVHNGKDYTDLTLVRALINSSVTAAQGCYVLYYQSTNSLFLENDVGTAKSAPLTPGTVATLSNSQCTVNGAGTTVSGSGATLTLNLSLSAWSTFLGTKNIYLMAQDSEGASSGWQNLGTWTPIGGDIPPTADAVVPTSSSAPNQVFSLTYSAQNGKGYTDLTWVKVLINSTVSPARACYVLYDQTLNRLYLENDAGTGMLGPVPPGYGGTLSNSQCAVDGTLTSLSWSGATLTLNLWLRAASSFLGTKNIYMMAQDSEGVSSGWQNRGTWTPMGADTAPTADSVTPTPASGANQTFSLAYSVQNGKTYSDLTWLSVLINPRVIGAQGCYVLYYQPTNQLYLENDAATGASGPLTPGTAGTLANSQCTVNGTGTTVSGAGATLTLNLSVSAASGFLGSKNIYMLAQDSEGTDSGWQNRGAWTPIGADTAPTADSVTPTPASGTSQTFSLTYSAQNGKGYTDLTWVTALFNWGQSGTNGCYVRYYQPANQLYLRNDASTADLGPLTPGSAGTLANSQCTLNGAGSSVAGSGKSLVLNLSLGALSGFTGTKKLFMWTIDSEGTSSGWQNRGAWTP